MTIENHGKKFEVKENHGSWTLATKYGKIDLLYNVPKSDAPTLDELKNYVEESGLFQGGQKNGEK